VSVIMPVFNMERYVEAAVASVLAQSYEDFELIIVDDGATDRSVEICKGFDDARVRILHQRNRGLAAARNAGIRESRGEYIAFIDADDLWAPGKLGCHLAHLNSQPAVGVSYSCAAYIDETGKRLGIYQFPKFRNVTARDILLVNPIGNGSSAVIRRKVFDRIRYVSKPGPDAETSYFDESLGTAGEHECWVRIGATTDWLLEGLPEILVQYRTNRSGLSANAEVLFLNWQAMVQSVRTYSPRLVATYESLSEAYQLRYQAERTIMLNHDGERASAMIVNAIRRNRGILFGQPVQTLLTLCAAQLLRILPIDLYCRLERSVERLFGGLQRLVLFSLALSERRARISSVQDRLPAA
jgi:hypothetical protein